MRKLCNFLLVLKALSACFSFLEINVVREEDNNEVRRNHEPRGETLM